ncbi:MAG: hypothetical protein ABI140_07785 [Jatrophihabitantaceae bacterium]
MDVLASIAGAALVIAVWRAAVLTLVVARPARSPILYTGWTTLVRAPIDLIARRLPYQARDSLLAPVASVVMVSLVPFWLVLFWIGYGLLFEGLGRLSFRASLREAGSSLFTLGFSAPAGGAPTVLAFVAAGSGPLLIALLISYLPTLYGAFNRRETEVSLLAGRGGTLAWGPEILLRYQWAGLRSELAILYQDWERLMADLAESHSSYPILVQFRSPDSRRSWITSMMAVMDAAAIELARTPSQAPGSSRLVITGGSSALAAISRALGLPVVEDPLPTDPIGVSYAEFEQAWQSLDAIGFPSETDPRTAYRHFQGWRVNWEPQAYRIARLVQAPPLVWTGPRDGNLDRLPRPAPRNRRPDDVEGRQPVRPTGANPFEYRTDKAKIDPVKPAPDQSE